MAICERCKRELEESAQQNLPNPFERYREVMRERSLIDNAVGINLENGEWSPCWLWTGGVNRGGYGVIKANGKATYAHRVSFMAEYGVTELQLNHQCDTKHCINPRHLKAGTQLENMRDLTERTPWVRGKRY